jgi:uncharacterized membrane protein
MNSGRLLWVGVAIILAGLLLVILGAFTHPSSSSTIGGFVLIGPIPIVFGSGPNSGMFATAALVISVVMVAAYLASFFLRGSSRRRGG